jgi:hypothetical protein
MSFFITCAHAQSNNIECHNCNKKVWVDRLKTGMPKEVCIPDEYLVSGNYTKYLTDINGDGLNDYVFDWNKYPISDGDTIFTSVYLQQLDSSYKYFVTFDNLFPIQFKSYVYEQVKDKKLKELFSLYNPYKLKELVFNNDKIILNFWTEARAGLVLTYQFDKNSNDWFLIEQKSWIELEEETKWDDLGTPEPNQSIKNFNYLDWLVE